MTSIQQHNFWRLNLKEDSHVKQTHQIDSDKPNGSENNFNVTVWAQLKTFCPFSTIQILLETSHLS